MLTAFTHSSKTAIGTGRCQIPPRQRRLRPQMSQRRQMSLSKRTSVSRSEPATAAVSDVPSHVEPSLPACGERSTARERGRVRGALHAPRSWQQPLTPTLSPQAGRGSAPSRWHASTHSATAAATACAISRRAPARPRPCGRR
jgi:hypothetical protein